MYSPQTKAPARNAEPITIAFSGHVFQETKASAWNADPITLALSGHAFQETKASARNADPITLAILIKFTQETRAPAKNPDHPGFLQVMLSQETNKTMLGTLTRKSIYSKAET